MALLFLLAVAGLVAAAATFSRLLSFMRYLQAELTEPLGVVLEDPTSVEPAVLPTVFSPAAKSLSVVIPAYNEEARLGATLEEIINYLQQRRNRQGPHFTWEVIVVDDGSTDKTTRIAFDYVRRHGFDSVRLLRVPRNRGKGHAVRRGMLISRGEYILMADADGATRFSDLELLETAMAKCMVPPPGSAPGSPPRAGSNPAAAASSGSSSSGLGVGAVPAGPLGAALGSRAHLSKAAAAQRHALRNFLTKGFHFLVTFVAGGRIRDTQCGFKLFTRRAAALLAANQRLQRWCFDVELVWLADQLSIPTTEVFVQWTEMPGSKIRPTSIISMAFELLTLKVAYQLLGVWVVYTEAELHHMLS